MKTRKVKFTFTGRADGGRGWKDDVKNMLLDISKTNTRAGNPNTTPNKP